MLQSLSVENYALIDKLEIDFRQGLNIITGETGAGKSILLGALGLILGQRADSSSLKDNEKNCVIEGVFNIEKMNLKHFFDENDIDFDTQSVVRRIVTPSGKSRAYINDIPVNLNTLKEFGIRLIDIHSQHETLLLSNDQFQLNVVDSVAGNTTLLNEFKVAFNAYKKEERLLQALIDEQKKSAADFDYFSFQHQQLVDAKLKDEEQAILEEEEKELSNAEAIKVELQYCNDAISDADSSVISNLKSCSQSLKRIKDVFHKSNALLERIDSVSIELKDIGEELSELNEKVDINPERLTAIKERLDTFYTLQQKHRVSSIAELIAIRDDLEEKLSKISNFDERISTQKAFTNEQYERLVTIANALTEKRNGVKEEIQNYVAGMLIDLGMPYAKLKVEISQTDLSVNGADHISFLFSSNKQLSFQEIAKVASGGELSRLMLTIKTMLAKQGDLPTIIFDEIDTGVSGEIADKMGSIIKELSKDIQVINITHLPQIASKGDFHFFVYKESDDIQTSTKIRLLTKDERILEIAKMLSGQNVTPAAIQNAKTLLKN